MADLSGYSPIYVRSNGNDATGDGSIGSPFLTAQKAFEVAYAGSGNKVLDFGAGNFGGVDLNVANASEWPNRIAVRGAGATQSFLGGIDGNGIDAVFDYDTNTEITPGTSGNNISVVSDKSINLGDIYANAGDVTPGQNGLSAGSISLTDTVSEDIYSNGGKTEGFGDGGSINLINSTCKDIYTNASGDNTGGTGGSVTLVNSISRDIISNGNDSFSMQAGNGGSITLTNSTSRDIYSNGGYIYNGSAGSGGSISLNNSNSNNIYSDGGNSGFSHGGSGGIVTIQYATFKIISVSKGLGDPSENGNFDGSNGSVIDNGNNTGYWLGTFYILSVATTLDQNGDGYWNNTYYLYGEPTTLDQNGDGCWNNTKYASGSPAYNFSGWNECDNTYYINGQQTTLDSSGSGSWNGNTYLNGQIVPQPRTLYYNAAVDTDWNNLGNWWMDSNHTVPATSLPTSIDDAIMTAMCSTNSGSEPTIVNLTFNAPNELFLAITIAVSGNAIFSNFSVNVGTITGNVTFNDSSYNTGTINGNVTFNEYSNNNGFVLGNAIFNNSSVNYSGYVNGNATFNDSSYTDVNSSIGTIFLGTRTPYPLRYGINNSNILGMI